MKIYFGHSRDFDYQNELYNPIRTSELNSIAEIIFPHEDRNNHFNSKEDLKSIDFMVAEASYPSTGLGIELGYADIYKIPIIVAYKAGFKVSESAKSVAQDVVEYKDIEDLVEQIKLLINA